MDYIDDEESDQFFRIIGEICRINERGRKMTNIEHYASRSVSKRRVKRFKKKLAKEDKEKKGEYGYGSFILAKAGIIYKEKCEIRKIKARQYFEFIPNFVIKELIKKNQGGVYSLESYSLTAKGREYYSDLLLKSSEVKNEVERKAKENAEEERLLHFSKMAAEAKKYAESNPNDALAWLKFAKAMEEADLPKEAEIYRKKAMNLMEMDTSTSVESVISNNDVTSGAEVDISRTEKLKKSLEVIADKEGIIQNNETEINNVEPVSKKGFLNFLDYHELSVNSEDYHGKSVSDEDTLRFLLEDIGEDDWWTVALEGPGDEFVQWGYGNFEYWKDEEMILDLPMGRTEAIKKLFNEYLVRD